uniref:PilZ domain-containing protein n=1 Tax=uncultured Sphingomonas sp. TaxID=158754 RepID=UPI0025F4E369|nr:PilZ domain-containing protein [uncultured Sphingomonas sp.]
MTIDARIASQASADDRRIAPRAPVKADARLRELGTEGAEATVLNISSTGFMAETAGEFAPGARVWLILPGRERANAVVRWADGKRIGAEFAQPINLSGLLGR